MLFRDDEGGLQGNINYEPHEEAGVDGKEAKQTKGRRGNETKQMAYYADLCIHSAGRSGLRSPAASLERGTQASWCTVSTR